MNYTPTDDEVREDFAYPWEGFAQNRKERLAAFDRWLVEHDARVEAKALRDAVERHKIIADLAGYKIPVVAVGNLLDDADDRML